LVVVGVGAAAALLLPPSLLLLLLLDWMHYCDEGMSALTTLPVR
jgi:hypothetical protein